MPDATSVQICLLSLLWGRGAAEKSRWLDVGPGLHTRKISLHDMQCVTTYKIVRHGQIDLTIDRVIHGDKQKNQATIFLGGKYIQNP